MSKVIQVTLTSTIYTVLGDYIKDYRSPAFPYSLRKNGEENTTDKFDWEDYARQFASWLPVGDNEGPYATQNKTQLSIDAYLNDTENQYQSNFARIVKAFKNYPDKLDEIRNNTLRPGGYLNIPLKPGIVFSIPIEKISRQSLLTQGVEVVSNNEPAFKARKLLELESDLGYQRIFEQDSKNLSLGNIEHQFPNITVWIWCRALSENPAAIDYELKGQLFNITPFITSLDTSNTENGGNFSLSLMPIVAERDKDTGKWIAKKNSNLVGEDGSVIFHSNTHKPSNISQTREQILFHNMINTNDLVFIRYETLEMEKEQRVKDNQDFIIDKSNLAGRIYDQIGLVDRNILNNDFQTNSMQVNISGRDLSKLFIEDGTYFYAMEYKDGTYKMWGGATQNNELTGRILGTGAYLYLGKYFNNTIEEIIKFVIQQLSNITIVPDDLFDSYATESSVYNSKQNSLPNDLRKNVDRRNKTFNDKLLKEKININDVKSSIEKNREDLIQRKKNITQKITEFRVKQYSPNKLIKELDIQKTSPAIFEELYKFIKFTMNNISSDGSGQVIAKFINIPLPQNTTGLGVYNGWRPCVYENEQVDDNVFPRRFYSVNSNSLSLFYNFVDTSTIYYNQNISEICTLVYNYIVSEKNLNANDIINDPYQVSNGIWQIIKLVIDKKVAKRILIDSSISSAQGSLMNFLQKVAQQPFVEIMFDTYGDEFYIVVRQPPTDKVGMQSFLTKTYQDVGNLNLNDDSLNAEAIVSIADIDIISSDLVFDDSQVYSWYHFTPQSALIGTSTKYPTAYIPAIYFEEYAKIWGSKPLDFVHNYMNYYSVYKEDSPQDEFSEHEKQMFYDMKYVIESSQYLPFSRKGTITINGGDRRIKIGNPIRLLSTGEIFWVDSVSNNFSISTTVNRVTTVQVSRGLNESFIFGVKGYQLNNMFPNSGTRFTNDKLFSYFSIINTDLDFTKKKKVKKTKKVPRAVDISQKDKSVVKTENIQGSDLTVFIDETQDPRNQLFYKNLNITLRSSANETYLKGLSPEAQPVFRRFLNRLDQIGWDVIITSGFRTQDEQKRLWEKNKKNARPGTSPHERGIAIDINVIARKNINGITKGTQLFKAGVGRQLKDTEPNRLATKPVWVLSDIPKIAKEEGLMWGGDSFNNYTDNVHFQLPTRKSSTELIQEDQEVVEYDEVPDGEYDVIDPESVFANFKVDKEIFNFFLRRQQMGIVSYIDNVNTLNKPNNSNVANPEQMSSLSKDAKNKLKNSFTKFR